MPKYEVVLKRIFSKILIVEADTLELTERYAGDYSWETFDHDSVVEDFDIELVDEKDERTVEEIWLDKENGNG